MIFNKMSLSVLFSFVTLLLSLLECQQKGKGGVRTRDDAHLGTMNAGGPDTTWLLSKNESKGRRAVQGIGRVCAILCIGDYRKKLDVKDIRRELENTVADRTR